MMSPMSGASLAGRLLVATPLLRDPTFARAVVLLLDHDGDGALGVVVNRPTEVPVTDVLPAWQPVVSDPDVLFRGGPVARDSALGLVQLRQDSEPVGVRRVTGPLALVDLDTPPEVVEAGLVGMRVFAGYSGWSPEQLETEIAEGAWYVVDAAPGDAFSLAPETLWRAVLRRQRGELAMVSTYPDDPTLN
jgi:putative transcriptional regulator